jgi:hypothetical protein
MTGFLTTYKVFYPIYGIFFMTLCLFVFKLILEFPNSCGGYLQICVLLILIWFHSSFVFTKIFHNLNEGVVYWRWVAIMSPYLILASVLIFGLSLLILVDLSRNGLENLSMPMALVCSLPYLLIYSIFSIASYLDGGYVHSYWIAFFPLVVYLIFGFLSYLVYKNTTNSFDEKLKEIPAFIGLFFVLFLIGNWLNWIPNWILFLPIDFTIYRGLYLMYDS